MRLILALCLATSVGSTANALQSNPPSDASPRREVHIHAPAGTKIGPNDKVVPGTLLRRVNPTYPPLARQTRISGTVRFHVTITTEGSVQDLQVVSGHPLLVQSATDAVRQWKYQPTLLNGQPVEVDTTIDVIFSLDEGPGTSTESASPLAPQLPIDPQLKAEILRLFEVMHLKEQTAKTSNAMVDSLR